MSCDLLGWQPGVVGVGGQRLTIVYGLWSMGAGPERRPVAGEAVRRQKYLVAGTYTERREIASPGIAARADRLVTLPLRVKKR